MENSATPSNPMDHIGTTTVPRPRGRPRRQSTPVITPQVNQTASSDNRRRRTQLRNRG
jgi:hypothetical protein